MRNSRSILTTPSSTWGSSSRRPNFNQRREGSMTSGPRKFNKIDSKPVFQGSKRLSTKEMDDKRANGLCYWCDEKYTPEHKCSRRKQLFLLELDEEIEESLWEDELEDNENSEKSTLNPQVSVHARGGTSEYRTMRVKGVVKRKMVHVLIDSGSTHNFMDLAVAKKLGCRLQPFPPSLYL